MASTTTFLDLVNRTIFESGTDLEQFATDGSDFTATGLDPLAYKFKKWVQRAWQTIQQESYDWEWMSEQAVVNLQPGFMFYSPETIDWSVDAVNPLTIYDTDGTPRVTAQTPIRLGNLTGQSTVNENYGWLELASSNTAPVSFTLKSGGEYFLTEADAIDSLVFTQANREIWTLRGQTPQALPTLTGYPSVLVVPPDGTNIIQVTIAIFDDGSYVTPTSEQTFDITGIARPSVGTPSSASVLEMNGTDGLTSFITALTTALNDPLSDVVCVAMDTGVQKYGGIVKAQMLNGSSQLGFRYAVSVQPNVYSLAFEQVLGVGGWGVFGGWSATTGAEIQEAVVTDTVNLVDWNTVCSGVLSADVTAEQLNMRIFIDGDSDSLPLNTLYQDSMCFASLDEDYDIYLYPEEGNVSMGVSSSIEDSGDLIYTTSISVGDAVPSKINYIHSWKSYDWMEEMQEDDFIEDLAEIDQQSFRIVYHEDPTPSSEIKLAYVHWEQFRKQMDNANQPPGQPRYVTEDNTGRWKFYPALDRPYTFLFDYVRNPQVVEEFDDIFKKLPDDLSDIVMWMALIYYGEYQEQPSIIMRATKNYKNLLFRLQLRFRDKFHFASAFTFSGWR